MVLLVAVAAAVLALAGCAQPDNPEEAARATLWFETAGFMVLLAVVAAVVGLVVALVRVLDREPRQAPRPASRVMTEEQYWGERYAAHEPTPAAAPDGRGDEASPAG
jgi:hypothetical protein